jgi:hypothetical protein
MVDFKAAMFDLVIEAIRLCDQECGDAPATRRYRLRRTRRKHHLIVIADRMRRSSPAGQQPAGDALEKVASLVLYHRGSASSRASNLAPRTRREEKLLLSARVSWHRLSRIAGVQPLVRAAAPRRQSACRVAAVLRAIGQPGLVPEARARILEGHVSGRIDELVSVAREAMQSSARPSASSRSSAILRRCSDGRAIGSQSGAAEAQLQARTRPTKGERKMDEPGPASERGESQLRPSPGRLLRTPPSPCSALSRWSMF